MARFNNVELERLRQTREQFERDPASARRTQVLEGEWVLGNGAPQFRAILQYEHGQSVLEMDNPSFMGGGGTLPGPMHYCFSGLAACYASTFAIVAAELGLELRQLRVRVEADVNFLRTFGLADAPTMEEVRVQLLIDSPASDEQLQHAEELARQRCPVVYTLTHPIRLQTSWQRATASAPA